MLSALGPSIAFADGRERVSFRARRARVDVRQIELCDAHLGLQERGWTLAASRIVLRARRVEARGRVVVRPCGRRGTSALFADRLVLRESSVRLEHVRLRVLGVTSPAIPWVELVPSVGARGTPNIGLLPPELGWRRDVGVAIGLGAYVPLGRVAALEPRARFGTVGSGADLHAFGRDFDARGEMSVRHRGGALAAADAQVATHVRSIALAADARVVEGPRSWLAPSSSARLRRVDEAAASLELAEDHVVAASSVEAWRDATNGSARWSGVAPRAVLGAGFGLGPWSLDAGLDVDAPVGASAWSRTFAETAVAGGLGPLRLGSIARAELRDPTADDLGHALTAAGSASVSLRRGFARGWVHRIVPRLGVSGALSVRERARSVGRPAEPLPREEGAMALVGIETSLAHHGQRVAEIEIASRLPFVERPEPPTLHARVRTRLRVLTIDASAAWLAMSDASAEPALSSIAMSTEIGPRLSVTLGVLHTTERADEVAVARPFDALVQGAMPLARRDATLLGASLRTPWLGPIGLSAGADVDAGRAELARVTGGLALRDGCVVVLATGAWLRGDDAPDLRLAMELTR